MRDQRAIVHRRLSMRGSSEADALEEAMRGKAIDEAKEACFDGLEEIFRARCLDGEHPSRSQCFLPGGRK